MFSLPLLSQLLKLPSMTINGLQQSSFANHPPDLYKQTPKNVDPWASPFGFCTTGVQLYCYLDLMRGSQ